MRKGRIFVGSVFAAILSLGILIPEISSGQTEALNGVLVDGHGVLKMRIYEDPGGRLMQERIAAARAALPQDICRKSPLRKISINRLEAALENAIANNRQSTDAIRYLAGMTRLEYVFYYPETKDIVLAGPAEGWMKDASGRVVGLESGQPCLELQDLIVAPTGFFPGLA